MQICLELTPFQKHLSIIRVFRTHVLKMWVMVIFPYIWILFET